MLTSELTYLWYNMFNACSVISRWSGNAAVGLTRRNNGAARNPRTTVRVQRRTTAGRESVSRPGQRATDDDCDDGGGGGGGGGGDCTTAGERRRRRPVRKYFTWCDHIILYWPKFLLTFIFFYNII